MYIYIYIYNIIHIIFEQLSSWKRTACSLISLDVLYLYASGHPSPATSAEADNSLSSLRLKDHKEGKSNKE